MSASHVTSVRTYAIVYGLLLALMVATIGASFFHTGVWHLPIAMAIASVKGFLILAYFMHVKGGSKWIILFFGLSIYVLGIGAILTFADYAWRT